MKETPYVPVNEPLLTGNEGKYLQNCIDTGWISSEGPYVGELENKVKARVDRKHGIAVCNGSVALEVALACLNIGEGDEVILPSHTIISCAAAIVRAGATPVLVDSDLTTWNMRPEEIAKKISRKTKAIMVVHIYGLPVDMNPVFELAQKHGLKIIEDAAEMMGQRYYERPCGSLGDISTFSFYPNKLITTGEGGMVLTDNDEWAEKARSFRNLCFQPAQRFLHEELGWNFRMSNLQAALGVAQCERWDEFVDKKRAIGRRYDELLGDLPHIQKPLRRTPYAENIYWVYGLLLKDSSKMTAKMAMERLQALKIGMRPFFWPMHEQPVFKKRGHFTGESNPRAECLGRQGFYIPSGMALTESQQVQVAEAIKALVS